MALSPAYARTLLWYTPVLCLCVTCFFVWHTVFAGMGSGMLTVAFLDVGQGDAIYIETPGGAQVLIDGGEGMAVLRALGTVRGWNNRIIDVVIATHPDLDHIGGLPEVFSRYEIGMYLEPCVVDGGEDHVTLLERVREENLEPVCVRRGMTLLLDEGVTLSFLFPDRDVSTMDANAASVVARLTYGDTSFLFMGDSPRMIEEYLVSREGSALKSEVLKVGHHGSKTSTSENFLGHVNPRYAIASVGCNNTYGHPHEVVRKSLIQFGVTLFTTCDEGTIIFRSDGVLLRRVE